MGGDATVYTKSADGSHAHVMPAQVINLPTHQHSIPAQNITLPTHNHGLIYGIYDDTAHPTTVKIRINGTNYTTALGGPWAAGGGALSITLDITEQINAAATFQQLHEVEIFCTSGQGEIEATIDIISEIQLLKAIP